jgi:uncharacterized protein (DUF952 family)
LILPQLDLDDGFVHTSSALQTPDTLRLFFKDIEGVWILKINAERLANWRKIDWVQGSGVDTNEKGTSHRFSPSALGSLGVIEKKEE